VEGRRSVPARARMRKVHGLRSHSTGSTASRVEGRLVVRRGERIETGSSKTRPRPSGCSSRRIRQACERVFLVTGHGSFFSGHDSPPGSTDSRVTRCSPRVSAYRARRPVQAKAEPRVGELLSILANWSGGPSRRVRVHLRVGEGSVPTRTTGDLDGAVRERSKSRTTRMANSRRSIRSAAARGEPSSSGREGKLPARSSRPSWREHRFRGARMDRKRLGKWRTRTSTLRRGRSAR